MKSFRILNNRIVPVIIVLSLFLVLGIVFLFLKIPTKAKLIEAEHEIYAIVLSEQRDRYSDGIDKFQILENTNFGEFQGYAPINSAGFNFFDFDIFPDARKKTWTDLFEKNEMVYKIKDFLPDIQDVHYINPTYEQKESWWISLSRIGFNPTLTQAIVLVGDCRGEACYHENEKFMYSTGYMILLQKKRRVLENSR